MGDKKRGSGLPSKRDIRKFVDEAQGEVSRREIARAFGVKGAARADLRRLLKEMTENGQIGKWERRKTVSLEKLPKVLVIDIVDQDTDGELLGAPAKWRSDAPPPRIYLAPGEGAGATGGPALGVGDRVLARLTPIDGAYEARIIRRIGQSAHRILALYRATPAGGKAEPVDRKTRADIRIDRGDAAGARDGDLVLVELKRDRAYGVKRGRVVEIAGRIDDQKSISLIAIHAHRILTGFPDEALREAARAPAPDVQGRVDLRETPLITIDPEDARDHDDAVWAAADDDPKNKGGHKAIVAIADVAHFVRPGSALDKAALIRGNSTYLPDRVAPMLPEALSTDLCSLHEGEDRACLAVEMIFDKDGRKRRHRFMRAVMRSHGAVSYEQAQIAHEGRPDDKTAPLLDPVIKPLFAAYAALARAREARGPLDLDLPERKIVFGPDDRVAGVAIRDRFDAHRLIEEFMVQANVCAAETLEEKRTPLIYRIHEAPDPEKIEALRDYLESVGYSLPKGQVILPNSFNQILKIARAREEEEMISDVVLRSQSQAYYGTENLGHFGLRLARYAHFTSPIRRYADLVVHRCLIRALKLGEGGLTDAERETLNDTAQAISFTERRSMAAERDSVDRFMAAFMEARIGAEFDGRIRGVSRFGVFVRLDETGAEGLVPIRALGAEYFTHDEARHALIGEESGLGYRLGQKVRVRLDEAAPVTGGMRFTMLTPPEAVKGGKSGGRKRGTRKYDGKRAKRRGGGKNKARKDRR